VKSGTLQYTFASPKATYGAQDTLDATLTVHDVGSTTDTLAVGGLFTWSLQNSSGQAVVFGGGANNSISLVPINPGESEEIGRIYQVIADTSGKAVSPGSYTLNVDDNQILFSFKLSIE
jgi:hypothetical protein